MNIKNIDFTSPLYTTALDIRNSVWPNYTESINEWKHFDKNYDPKYLLQRFVVLNENLVIGTGLYGEPWWSYLPGKIYFEINILQNYRNKGFGSKVFNHIVNILIERNGKKIYTNVKEDMSEGVHFLENRGFTLVLVEPESTLYLQDFDINEFKEFEEQFNNKGIIIKSLSELQKVDQNWENKLYRLYAHIMKDVPNNDPHTDRTFENFKKQKLQAPGFDAKAHFIALDGNDYVGLSSLWMQESDKTKLWTDLTGVLRDHRRRGIALALKLKTIQYAMQIGVNQIETDNEENNPMLGINKLLGFVPKAAWLTYEKRYS